MDKKILEKLVNRGLEAGADFSEVFYEEKKEINISFSSSIVNKCAIAYTKGVGIRLADKTEVYYASTNDLNENNLFGIIDNLNQNFNGKRVLPEIVLGKKQTKKNKIEKEYSLNNLKEIKNKLLMYDKYARTLDKKIDQVVITLVANEQNVTIANSFSNYVRDTRNLTRIIITIIAKENEKCESSSFNLASSTGLEIINDEKIYKRIKNAVKVAIEKLEAKSCPGGEMPVVISNGFGGVIIHEACGHAMEATSVADGTSVLSDKLGTKIASSKVTIIDDGTILNSWGTTNYDDEGNATQKNILIKDGVLEKFLIDEINNRILKKELSGSGRREDFRYAPTSRMNNTYLEVGNDTIEDMISSIDYGLYAKNLGGGIVNPATGDFNFTVLDAYMIRNGKLAEPVKGASLIGNTLEILNLIEMIGNDLEFSAGICGSLSGSVPVTVGQPTIKVSKILVGGGNND